MPSEFSQKRRWAKYAGRRQVNAGTPGDDDDDDDVANSMEVSPWLLFVPGQRRRVSWCGDPVLFNFIGDGLV